MEGHLQLLDFLYLPRCPHCGVARPTLEKKYALKSQAITDTLEQLWQIYLCTSCGSVVSAFSYIVSGKITPVVNFFPGFSSVDESVPERARDYLSQAKESLHAPAGAVLLAASAVDAMLKVKEFKTGSLYDRIEKAVTDHLITPEMATWAHQVRLDANDQRHADVASKLPVKADAERVIEFADALAQYLFVLPSRIAKGTASEEN